MSHAFKIFLNKEVFPIIQKLKNNKYLGYDLINNKRVKNHNYFYLHFKCYFLIILFPNHLEVIITILKPGKQPDIPESYQLINRLSVFEKLLFSDLLLSHYNQMLFLNFNLVPCQTR